MVTNMYSRYPSFPRVPGDPLVFRAPMEFLQKTKDPQLWLLIFWSLRDDNRPDQSVSSGVSINKTICSMLGPLSHLAPMLGLCWAYVGPRWAQVWQLSRFYDVFQNVEKYIKIQDSREKIATPSPRLPKFNSYCNCFRSMHTKEASAP